MVGSYWLRPESSEKITWTVILLLFRIQCTFISYTYIFPIINMIEINAYRNMWCNTEGGQTGADPYTQTYIFC